MTHEELPALLRSHADPEEAVYRPRPLPLTLEEAKATLKRRRLGIRQLAVPFTAAAAGVALVLVAGLVVSVLRSIDGAGNAPSSRPCQSADFAIRSQPWPDAPMAGGMIVIFQSRATGPCSLPYAAIHIAVAEATGAVLIEAKQASDEPVDVRRGEALQAGISWSSYCGGPGFPDVPVRPLTLSAGIEVVLGEGDGVVLEHGDGGGYLITSVEQRPVATASEIAPSPCMDEVPGSPFELVLTQLHPYPGPLSGGG